MPARTRLAAAALGATAVATHPATVSALAAANEIASGDLHAGQLLQIPDATLGLPAYTRGSVDVESYRVHAGEGVFEIARRFGVDATALARANGIGVNAPLAEGAELQIPGRLARMNALLTFVAGEVQVDPRLVRAVAWVESGWRQDAVSATGAVGIMQLEPFTGDWVSRHLAQRRLDIWVAQDNVLAGSLLLQHLSNTHAGDPAATLAGYYQGDASVASNGIFGDTRRYQERVGSLMSQEA